MKNITVKITQEIINEAKQKVRPTKKTANAKRSIRRFHGLRVIEVNRASHG